MFNQSKYTTWYNSIIASQDTEGEIHHIIPRCMGGSDDESNLVTLSLRKHFVAHMLLVKMVDDHQLRYKLMYAFCMMSKTRKINSRAYELMKQKYFSLSVTRAYNPETDEEIVFHEGDILPYGFQLGGRPKSEEWKESRRGHKQSDDHILKRTSNQIGKTFWINAEGNCKFCKEYPGEGWIKQSKTKGKKYKPFKFYKNDNLKKNIAVFEGDEIPEGFVEGRGNYSTASKERSRNAALNMAKHANNKGRKIYHNPITLEQKNLLPNDEIPEGFVEGRSPKNVKSGYKQSELQKSRASEANQKTYKITYLDGSEELIEGIVAWRLSKGISKSRYDYLKKTNRLHEIGISSVEQTLAK